MAIVRKRLANKEFTRIDNFVAQNNNISDYSVRLYLFMAGFKDGFQLNDAYVAKALDWSRSKIARAKRDLVEEDLILIDKVDRTTYFLYIGTSKMSATNVKFHWDKLEKEPEKFEEICQGKPLQYKEK